jgi:TPR repeat protein
LSSKKWLIPALVALVLVLGASLYYLWGRESSLAVPPLQQAYNHLIRENPDPEASLRLALVLQKEGSSDAYDAAFLLFENAAQKDNGRAMIFMGEYYDPLDSKPNGSIIKDSEQAFAWYNRALQMGEENAQTKLDALRKWMDEHGEE